MADLKEITSEVENLVKNYNQMYEIAKEAQEMVKGEREKRARDAERHYKRTLEYITGNNLNRGENTVSINDLKKKGKELMEKTQVYSEKADQARNKKQWFKDLIKNDETEILADEQMTLEQMQKLAAIREK